MAEGSVGREQRHRDQVLGEVLDVGALADQVDDVAAESVDATVEPVPQRVEHRRFDVRVRPVEVGLFREEHVEIRLVGGLVVRPRRHALEQ